MSKTMDSTTLSAEKLDICVLRKDPQGNVVFLEVPSKDLEKLVEEVKPETLEEEK